MTIVTGHKPIYADRKPGAAASGFCNELPDMASIDWIRVAYAVYNLGITK
jgi:hypothetical protein